MTLNCTKPSDASTTCLSSRAEIELGDIPGAAITGEKNEMSDDESGVPEHWHGGVGYAPRFGRNTARAYVAMEAAQNALQATLKADYPLGARVDVIHHRGHFTGVVEGWDYYGARVLVRNDATQKASKWWAAHVQLHRGLSGRLPPIPRDQLAHGAAKGD